MQNFLKFFSIVLALVTSAAQAEPPKEMKSMFPKPGAKGREVISLDSLTVEQKRIQKDGISSDPDGYQRVVVSNQYVNMLSELNVLSQFTLDRDDLGVTVNGLEYLGLMDEGTLKKSLAFGSRSGAEIFVTGWKYSEDGASIVMTKDFFNQEIDGMTGTLSLAVASDTNKCIWKLFVADNEISFDIMIADTMVNKKPKMTPQKVSEIARKLIAFTQTKL